MNSSDHLERCFAGRTVLVTGHTGFKGSWLSHWLHGLGARVVGLSDRVPTEPANFEASAIAGLLDDHRCDLADREAVARIVADARPDFVFHLAAQALVRDSYARPVETLMTNIMGTAHVLDALRQLDQDCVALLITSDKCYDNIEWEWGYRENDRLGGKDPYSASKGGAELVIRTFVESWLRESPIRVGVARAGNVIGGGDWAANRLVPDCIRAWSRDETVRIHNPAATRPWQLVLEPLGGYLALAMALAESPALDGEAFNFGPLAENDYSVEALIEAMREHWDHVHWERAPDAVDKVYEAGLLKLNCDKALHHLGWRPTYGFHETVAATMDWYRRFYTGEGNMQDFGRAQIDAYRETARSRGIAWAL